MNKISFALVLSFLLFFSVSPPAQAATFPVTNETELVAAVNTANGNSEADVIDLGGNNIQLSTNYDNLFGDIGLPTISSEITFQNGTIGRNSAVDFRIMRIDAVGIVTLDNIIIENGLLLNTLFDGAGVINNGTLVIRNSIIRNNTAGRGGGGIYNGGALTIVNSLIVGNSAGTGGGAIINFGTSLDIINSTIANNTASSVGGVLFGPFNVRNSIIWGNSGTNLAAGSDPASVSYSVVQGGFTGTGNLNLDPLFVNSAGGDYSLMAFSPAIDSADSSLLPGGITLDLAGDTRQVNDLGIANNPSTLDRGAYEFQTVSSYTASITANDNAAAESPANNGQFTVSLDRVNQSGSAITINYSIAGTAANGSDYNTLTGSVTIAANQQSATINLVPINDDFAEAVETVTLTLTSSSVPAIVSIDATPATVNITSDDIAAVTINPLALSAAEGDTASYTIVLDSQPAVGETVTITVTISGAAVGEIANTNPATPPLPAAPTITFDFTHANWNTPQQFDITLNDDSIANDNRNYIAAFTHSSDSTDPASDYAAAVPLVIDSVDLDVIDNETPNVVINPTSFNLIIGDSQTYDVSLTVEPASDVTITLNQLDANCTISPSSLTFTNSAGATPWNLPQQITVTAIGAARSTCTIQHTPTGSGYTGLLASDVLVTVRQATIPSSPSTDGEPNINVFDPAISKLGLLFPGQTGIVGEKLEWIVTVSNTGTVAGTNVTITDTLIPALQIDSVDAVGATVTITGQTVTVVYPTLAVGQSVQFSIITTVLQGATIENTACVTAANQGAEECAIALPISQLPNTGETPIWAYAALLGLSLLGVGMGFFVLRRKNATD